MQFEVDIPKFLSDLLPQEQWYISIYQTTWRNVIEYRNVWFYPRFLHINALILAVQARLGASAVDVTGSWFRAYWFTGNALKFYLRANQFTVSSCC